MTNYTTRTPVNTSYSTRPIVQRIIYYTCDSTLYTCDTAILTCDLESETII